MQKVNLRWGQKGEHLVLFQVMLMVSFVVLPVYPIPISVDAGLLNMLGMFQWAVLVLCWTSALLLGGWGSKQLRRFLTPLPYPVDHNQLVTSGAYALVRHPLYSALLLSASGWTVFNLSISHFCLTLLGFLFFRHKASCEESWLTERHPEYADYARKVKRFIPWIY